MIKRTGSGLYCIPGDFYIDPHRKVKTAIVTHAHSDHAYRGHAIYYCCSRNEALLRARIAKSLNIISFPYDETFELNGVTVSFYPAGHIAGSAQVRLEWKGETWVITGDYKIEDDGFTEPYQVVNCDHFVSECTFGLPIYQWVPQEIIQEQMLSWVATVRKAGGIAVFNAYSLGKAQRIQHILRSNNLIFVDPTVGKMNEAVEKAGYQLPEWRVLDTKVDRKKLLDTTIVVGGASAETLLAREFGMDVYTSLSSGWMALPRRMSGSTAHAKFTLSDHADWTGLNWAIEQSGADHIYLMHGDPSALTSYWEDRKRVFNWNN